MYLGHNDHVIGLVDTSLKWKVHGRCVEGAWKGAWKVRGRCMEGAWKVHGRCMEGAGKCMEGVWKEHGRCGHHLSEKIETISEEVLNYEHPRIPGGRVSI